MDDQQIIALYWARAEDAIAETAKRYGRYCYKIANNILHSREDTEECVNDTWLRAWDAMPPHRPERLDAFLGKITRNLALNRWEKAATTKRGGGQVGLALEELRDCLPSADSVESAIDTMALTEALNRFLAALPAETRRIFIQRYWYMRPIKVIAAELGVGESKVKMTLLRTRAELKQYLEQEEINI